MTRPASTSVESAPALLSLAGVGRIFTPEEAGSIIRASKKEILRAIHDGRLKAARIGSRRGYRIAERDLAVFYAGCTVNESPGPAPSTSAPRPPRPRGARSSVRGGSLYTRTTDADPKLGF